MPTAGRKTVDEFNRSGRPGSVASDPGEGADVVEEAVKEKVDKAAAEAEPQQPQETKEVEEVKDDEKAKEAEKVKDRAPTPPLPPVTPAPSVSDAGEATAASAAHVEEVPIGPAAGVVAPTASLAQPQASDSRSRAANTPNTATSRDRIASRPSHRAVDAASQPPLRLDQAASLAAPRRSKSVGRQPPDGQLPSVSDPPPGFGYARTLYVRQERPRPMTPLKAWSGYHGNVYFSPIGISRASYSHPDELLSLPSLPSCSVQLQRVLERSRLNASHVMQLRSRNFASPRQPRRRRPQASTAVGNVPVVQLAPQAAEYGADAQLYKSTNSTGTLQFQRQQQQQQQQEEEEEGPISQRQIYRGSVARKLMDLRQALASQQHQQQHHQHHYQQHNTSFVSLDREIDKLYERMPTLMHSVPRSHTMRHIGDSTY